MIWDQHDTHSPLRLRRCTNPHSNLSEYQSLIPEPRSQEHSYYEHLDYYWVKINLVSHQWQWTLPRWSWTSPGWLASTQWPAVRTCWFEMREPPHTIPFMVTNTFQGYSWGSASSPPKIFEGLFGSPQVQISNSLFENQELNSFTLTFPTAPEIEFETFPCDRVVCVKFDVHHVWITAKCSRLSRCCSIGVVMKQDSSRLCVSDSNPVVTLLQIKCLEVKAYIKSSSSPSSPCQILIVVVIIRVVWRSQKDWSSRS